MAQSEITALQCSSCLHTWSVSTPSSEVELVATVKWNSHCHKCMHKVILRMFEICHRTRNKNGIGWKRKKQTGKGR